MLEDNPVPWPDGARCAACVSFDLDADSLIHLARPQDAYGLNLTLSLLRYDEVGIVRAVRTLDALGVRGTFFATGWVMEQFPHAIDAIVASGHELANHGYLHELPNTQSRGQQLDAIERTSALIERFSGRRPVGWRAPWGAMANESAEILAGLGFLYDSSLQIDTQPVLLRSAAGDLVELPIDLAMDDWVHFAHVPDLAYTMPIKPPSQAFDVYRAELAGARASGGTWITIFHPHMTARPSRLLELARLVEEIREEGDVWLATMEEIAAHVRACIDDGRWSPRIVEQPFWPEPPAAFAPAG